MKRSNHMSINRNWHGRAQRWNVDDKILKEKPSGARSSLVTHSSAWLDGVLDAIISGVSSPLVSSWITNIWRAPFTHITSRSGSCLCPVCLCFVRAPNGVSRHKAEMKALFIATKSEWWCRLSIHSACAQTAAHRLPCSSSETIKQMTRYKYRF